MVRGPFCISAHPDTLLRHSLLHPHRPQLAPFTGETLTPSELVAQLQRSGYAENAPRRQNRFARRDDGIEIAPGPSSYFLPEPILVAFARNHVSRRRLVTFAEIPLVLQQAVTSTEDKRFLQHTGFDLLRIGKAAYVDLRQGRKEQGAGSSSLSTTPTKSISARKAPSASMALAKLPAYFLDLVNRDLPAHIQDHDIHTAHRIYTSLDLNL